MSKKKNLGVPVRKASPSRVARVPSPKKATPSVRSTRSRKQLARPGVWYSVERYLPASSNEFGDSPYVLCEMELTPAVVCWYMHPDGLWRVADHRANDHPVLATKWQAMPDSSDGTKHPVYLHAIAIGGAATKEPVRRTEAKRTSGKRGPKASPTKPANSTSR